MLLLFQTFLISIDQYGYLPIIVASTKSLYVIGYEEHQDLLIYNALNKSNGLIRTGFPYSKMRVAVNDELLATCTDPVGNFGQPIKTTIKIFSTNNRELIYTQKLDNFIGFSTDTLSSSSVIAIIQSTKLQILYKRNNHQVRKQVVGINVQKLFIIIILTTRTK